MTARGHQLSFVAESPDAEALAECKDVIERHIIRFAFREELTAPRLDRNRRVSGRPPPASTYSMLDP